MAINKLEILNVCYNFIDNNKQGVGISIYLPNTEPLLLLLTPYNIRGRNNVSIIIYNQTGIH